MCAVRKGGKPGKEEERTRKVSSIPGRNKVTSVEGGRGKGEGGRGKGGLHIKPEPHTRLSSPPRTRTRAGQRIHLYPHTHRQLRTHQQRKSSVPVKIYRGRSQWGREDTRERGLEGTKPTAMHRSGERLITQTLTVPTAGGLVHVTHGSAEARGTLDLTELPAIPILTPAPDGRAGCSHQGRAPPHTAQRRNRTGAAQCSVPCSKVQLSYTPNQRCTAEV